VKHSIYHYIPELSKNSGMPVNYQYKFCSPTVGQKVYNEIQDKSEEKTKEFLRFLRHFSQASTFLGWIYEKRCNSIFKDGGTFTFTLLPENKTRMKEEERGQEGSITLTLTKNSYQNSKHENTESIDGYFYDKETNILYLFQMTLSDSHPVSSKGIIKFIYDMKMENEPCFVRLIFVVEKGKLQKKQTITEEKCLDENSSVSSITGIGKGKGDFLQKKGINTVGDLVGYHNSDKEVNCCKELLEKHQKIKAKEESIKNKIQQYRYEKTFEWMGKE
jgi:hypothetical protein